MIIKFTQHFSFFGQVRETIDKPIKKLYVAGSMEPLKSSFTIHGRARLQERTAFEDIDVDGLISDGLAVNVGREVETQVVHWLLWSEADQKSFVVVRDEGNSEVLTIMEYRKNPPPRFNPHFEGIAKGLVFWKRQPSLAEANLPLLKIHHPNFRLVCDVVFRTLSSGREKISLNFIRKVRPFLGEISNFGKIWQDKGFLERLARKLRKFKSPVVLEQVFVRLNKGEAFNAFAPGFIFEIPREIEPPVPNLLAS